MPVSYTHLNINGKMYESFLWKQVSEMAAVAGLQHHHIGMFRLHQEKQGGDEIPGDFRRLYSQDIRHDAEARYWLEAWGIYGKMCIRDRWNSISRCCTPVRPDSRPDKSMWRCRASAWHRPEKLKAPDVYKRQICMSLHGIYPNHLLIMLYWYVDSRLGMLYSSISVRV